MRVIFTALAFIVGLVILAALAFFDWLLKLDADTWALMIGAAAICVGLSILSDRGLRKHEERANRGE